MGDFEKAKEEIEAMNLSPEEKEKEIRIRVDQAILDKLKLYKKELDSGSYGDALRTILGVESGAPVADKAIEQMEQLQHLVNERIKLEKLEKKTLELNKKMVEPKKEE